MNWKKNTEAEYDTKTAAGKEQEFVVWKHGKYHKVIEATVEPMKIHVLQYEGLSERCYKGFEQGNCRINTSCIQVANSL